MWKVAVSVLTEFAHLTTFSQFSSLSKWYTLPIYPLPFSLHLDDIGFLAFRTNFILILFKRVHNNIMGMYIPCDCIVNHTA